MKWLLRFFADYRDLEVRLVLAEQAREDYQRLVSNLRNEIEFYQKETARLNEEHIADLRKTADAYSFQTQRRNVFARIDTPPQADAHAQEVRMPLSQRQFARQLVQKKNAETLASLEKLRAEMDVYGPNS